MDERKSQPINDAQFDAMLQNSLPELPPEEIVRDQM